MMLRTYLVGELAIRSNATIPDIGVSLVPGIFALIRSSFPRLVVRNSIWLTGLTILIILDSTILFDS